MAMAVSGVVAPSSGVLVPISFSKAQLLGCVSAGFTSLGERRLVERNGKLVSRSVVRAVVGERAPGAALPGSAESGMRCS